MALAVIVAHKSIPAIGARFHIMSFALVCPPLPYSPHLAGLPRLLIPLIRLMYVGPGLDSSEGVVGTGLIFMTLIEILESRKEALDVHEVADLLQVSERHIYELAAGGKLPSFRIGKIIRFDPQDVADWLRQNKPPDRQHSPWKQKKAENLKPSRGGSANVAPPHVLRNKVKSLEVVLAVDRSTDGNFARNS